MATPESNTLLARQLFQPATDVITNDAAQRTALLTRIAEIQNQQRFQNEQAQQQQANKVTLENLRAQNSQTLAAGADQRALTLENLRAQNSRALAADAEERQLNVGKQAQDARDLADLHKQFSLAYPAYAKVAAIADLEAKPLSDFAQSWEGLGELNAELGTAQEAASKKDNSLAALAVLGPARIIKHELETALASFEAKSKLTEADQAAARTAGLAALQQAKLTGTISGVNDKKFNAGVAALSDGNLETARQTFGAQAPAILSLYEQGQQRERERIMNSPERKAEIAAIGRDVAVARQGKNQTLSRIAQAAAKNPEVGAGYQQLESDMMGLEKRAAGVQPQGNAQSLFDVAVPKVTAPPPPLPAQPSATSTGAGAFGSAYLGPLARLFPSSEPTGPQSNPMGAAYLGPLRSIFGGGSPSVIQQSPASPQPAAALAPVGPPIEVTQAAAVVANNPRSPGLQPYKSVIQLWLDNNGQGRPYSDENLQIRRLIQAAPTGY